MIICSLLILINCGCTSNQTSQQKQAVQQNKRVILIGASVGQAWDLKDLPDRLKDVNLTLESVAIYQFDKTEALDEVLMRPNRKLRFTRSYIKGFFMPAPQLPGAIIIKECASYFPGDIASYQQLLMNWVKRVRDAHMQIIVATVPPVTYERAGKRTGQIESIWEFNDWIRQYAAREHIPLLDLEASLRKSKNDRYLRDDLTSGDGLHLNKKAYDKLDKLLLDTLRSKD